MAYASSCKGSWAPLVVSAPWLGKSAMWRENTRLSRHSGCLRRWSATAFSWRPRIRIWLRWSRLEFKLVSTLAQRNSWKICHSCLKYRQKRCKKEWKRWTWEFKSSSHASWKKTNSWIWNRLWRSSASWKTLCSIRWLCWTAGHGNRSHPSFLPSTSQRAAAKQTNYFKISSRTPSLKVSWPIVFRNYWRFEGRCVRGFCGNARRQSHKR